MALEIEAKKGAFKSIRFVQLLAGFANGLSYESIAKQNGISEETAKTYGKILREELGVKDKAEALGVAIARGLISIKETGGKTLLSCLLIISSGFLDHHDYSRYAKTKIKPRIERRIDEA